jgi:hypothetical protein
MPGRTGASNYPTKAGCYSTPRRILRENLQQHTIAGQRPWRQAPAAPDESQSARAPLQLDTFRAALDCLLRILLGRATEVGPATPD